METPQQPSKQQKSITDFLASPFDPTKMQPLMTSTPIFGASGAAGASRKRKFFGDNDARQMVLDFGQKQVGMTNCEGCGMVYSVDDPKDKAAHEDFHNRFTNTKFFKVEKRSLESWKKKHYSEVNVGKVSGTIFKIERKGQSSLKTKLEKIVKEIIDVQLHICDDVPLFPADKETVAFVYIVDADKNEPAYIGAVAFAEKVYAAKLMPIGKIYKDQTKDYGFIAIERLWVHPSIRRKSVATHLLDVIRRLLSVSPHILMRSRIAFVDPTPVCVTFGKTFLGKGGYWMQVDGDESDTILAGLSMALTANPKEDERKAVKKEAIKPKPAKIVKTEKDDAGPSTRSTAAKKTKTDEEEKENIDQENPKEEIGKNMYRTLVIDESMDENTPLEVPLMPQI